MKNIILIPGLFGSSMQDSDSRVIWPPGLTNEAISNDELVDLLLDPATGPVAVIKQCVTPIYGPIIDMLSASPGNKVLPIAYDWRQDVRVNAQFVSDTLDKLTNQDPIIIVSHSMGGLVARWLLESLVFKNKAWFGRIKSLICVAVPHLGAPVAFFELNGTGGSNSVFLPAWATAALSSDPARYPSGYQLLPPADVECVSRDQTPSTSVPAAFGNKLIPEGLTALSELHDVLDEFNKPVAIDYYLAYGTGNTQTVSGIMLNIRNQPQEGSGDGDGTVPAWSGLPFLLQSKNAFKEKAAFITDHVGILSNSYFLKQLSAWVAT